MNWRALTLWLSVSVILGMVFSPTSYSQHTYTHLYWDWGDPSSVGPVYPDENGDCRAYLQQSRYPSYPYIEVNSRAELTEDGLKLGIYHMFANSSTSQNNSSMSSATAIEEFTVTGPGDYVDALMNLRAIGTLYISYHDLSLHQNNLEVEVYVQKVGGDPNISYGSFKGGLALWNDKGSGYINTLGGMVEFYNYDNGIDEEYVTQEGPFQGTFPFDGKMLIFDAPIKVPLQGLAIGETYYYTIRLFSHIWKWGAADTYNTLEFDPKAAAPIVFGDFTGDPPSPDNFIAATDQNVFLVQSTSGAIGEKVNNGTQVRVAIDVKPGSCPNPINIKSHGVLPVAILGTEGFDVTTIDRASIRLVGVAPIHSSIEDVATPFEGDIESCENCTRLGPDGYTDLMLQFRTQDIVAALGEVNDEECLILELTGNLKDGTLIIGKDVVRILKKGKINIPQ